MGLNFSISAIFQSAIPTLETRFSLNGIGVQWMLLEPNEKKYPILPNKFRSSTLAMRLDALRQFRRNAGVERAVSLAGKHVDETTGHAKLFKRWVAGSSPAMVILGDYPGLDRERLTASDPSQTSGGWQGRGDPGIETASHILTEGATIGSGRTRWDGHRIGDPSLGRRAAGCVRKVGQKTHKGGLEFSPGAAVTPICRAQESSAAGPR